MASPTQSPSGRHKVRGKYRPSRLAWVALSVVLRRQGLFLFAPLIYISGMLFYMGTVPFDVGPVITRRLSPASVYRSPRLYHKLRHDMDSDHSTPDAILTIWKNSYKGGGWKPCISKSTRVRVVNKIPDFLMERYDHNMSNVYNFRIKAWSPIEYYKDNALPRLLEEKVIRISPFANRLSFDAPSAVQRLRCLANYEALRFSSPILTLGETLVARMKERSANSGGKYVSVHIRFEEDMVAFSCCVFDGGKQERLDMDAARERGWRGKFTKPGRVIRPGAIRIDGKCPLTPLETSGDDICKAFAARKFLVLILARDNILGKAFTVGVNSTVISDFQNTRYLVGVYARIRLGQAVTISKANLVKSNIGKGISLQ
ncbi:hypothetical protein Cgig2_000385 [Carnegiea gigantea]|uniref:O-fucosyltransferase family protein n=1 Tax=Carnegiea gigantea TaxID=171969 RepID=A0A9Q1K5U0_9CARY|nr:hypothetical protein Cgig2_000385 [Carnegiea gigantea]